MLDTNTMSWSCLQHNKHKQGGLTKKDKKRDRAARGKEKKYLPCVSSRAVVREEHKRDRERKEKEGQS